MKNNDNIKDVIHYDSISKTLTIEDPKFLFYVRNLLWNKFAKQIGYIDIHFSKPYDVALSFAGENRDLAQVLFDKLAAREISVFYDRNEQLKTRFGENKIIPIWYSDTDISIFDETRKYGGYQFDVTPECFEAEADEIVELIAKKIEETRA